MLAASDAKRGPSFPTKSHLEGPGGSNFWSMILPNISHSKSPSETFQAMVSFPSDPCMVYVLTFAVKINRSLGKDTSLMDPMRVNHHFKPQEI